MGHAVGMSAWPGLTVKRHRMDKKAWAIEKEANKLKKTVRDCPVDRVSRPWISVGTCPQCAQAGISVPYYSFAWRTVRCTGMLSHKALHV